MYVGLQVHIGLWFITLQSVFVPQGPGHGLTHRALRQALSREHSELTTHSGRQFGGEPTYSDKQEQTA